MCFPGLKVENSAPKEPPPWSFVHGSNDWFEVLPLSSQAQEIVHFEGSCQHRLRRKTASQPQCQQKKTSWTALSKSLLKGKVLQNQARTRVLSELGPEITDLEAWLAPACYAPLPFEVRLLWRTVSRSVALPERAGRSTSAADNSSSTPKGHGFLIRAQL